MGKIVVTLILIVVLLACGSSQQIAQKATALPPLEESLSLSEANTEPEVSATPEPEPTATPLPTNTPISTKTPTPSEDIPTSTFTPEPTVTPLPPMNEPVSEPCTIEVPQSGRSEPRYVGMQGFLKAFISSVDYYESLPVTPWQVPILEQVGPELWEESGETLPAKTPVIVLVQHLKHEGFGRYSGFLVVKSLEDSKEYRIDHNNFTPTDYWNCPPHQAIKYSNFIAQAKEATKPVNKDGKWVEMGEQKEVFCVGIPGLETDDFVENGVECLMYKQYVNGFGGVQHIFPSNSLEIIY